MIAAAPSPMPSTPPFASAAPAVFLCDEIWNPVAAVNPPVAAFTMPIAVSPRTKVP